MGVDVNPMDVLKSKFSMALASEKRGIWRYVIDTPAHKFHVYVWMYEGTEWIFQLTVRDSVEDRLSECAYDFLLSNLKSISGSSPVSVFNGFVCAGWAFETMCVLNSSAHRSFVGEVPELHEFTFVVFPAYRCEFSGNETDKEIEFMRKNTVGTIDVRRSPSPKIKMWYKDVAKSAGSVGKDVKLDRVDSLRRVLRDISDDGESRVMIENYKGDCVSIRKSKEAYLICRKDFNGGEVSDSVSDVDAWINQFSGVPQ